MAQTIVSGLSGRYATALFELAKESNGLEAVNADLGKLESAQAASSDLASLMSSPRFSREQSARAIAAIAAELGLSSLTTKFLGVLAANRRLASFSAVRRDYAALMAAHRGETTADVTSAHPLTDAQLAALKAKLKTGLGRDVAIQTRVDPAILGGLVVKVGSKLIDSSLRTKLDALALHMKA